MTEPLKIEAKKSIKEGFLVKKGHLRRNWRTRWFSLTEDKLDYYKNRGDATPAGTIPLPGASLIVPHNGTAKKTFLMQLNSLCGKELMVQAPDQVTLTDWAESIEKVISEQAKKSLESIGATKKATAPSSVNHRDVMQAMQDRDAGVKLEDVTLKTTQIKKCFSGEAAVDWLIAWYFAKDRNEAVALAREMLLEGLFQCINDEMAKQISSGSCKKLSPTLVFKEFIDSPFVHYKFSAFNPAQSLELFNSSDDSSDQSSSDSSNDLLMTSSTYNTQDAPWSIGANSTRNPSDPIIKQGFLMKKRLKHVKQDWKARKFILRKNSPYLYYCKGSKESKLSGAISLNHCTVTEMDDKPLEDDTTSVKKYIKCNRFSLTTAMGERVVVAAPTAEDRSSWLQVLKEAIEEIEIS